MATPRSPRPTLALALAALTALPLAAIAGGVTGGRGDDVRNATGDPISTALVSVPDDVKIYNDHLTTLASPYMMGRVPGSPGMDRAREYCAYYLQDAGFEPAFPGEDGTPFSSYYDPFELGGTWEVTSEGLALAGAEGLVNLEPQTEFVFTGLGGEGKATGRAVFVGYGIDNGPDGFNSFAKVEDLAGKIAVLFRFEPMDDEGASRWSDQGWSDKASFANKLRALKERGAAGAVIINPPASGDERAAARLGRFGGAGDDADFPVFMLTPEAGEKIAKADPKGRSLLDLRRAADAGDAPVELNTIVTLSGDAKREPVQAANVGGVLRGSGALADQWIVVGAHLDHLGMGYFGSRSGPGKLHPGADDNASGSAGVLLLAQKLRELAPADDRGDRRSVLLMLFDGEESGLNGSRHYVQDPIAPIENHALMMNWDMIGRIEEERLSVAGLDTGVGMREFFEPLFSECGLDVRAPRQMSGASDHTSFYRAGVPVVFGSIDGLHADYHTPEDTSDKINRVGATKTVLLFADMVHAYASRPQRFALAERDQAASAAPQMNIKVRMGVMPGSYTEDEPGIPIAGVTPGGAAEAAGLKGGDRLVRWDGQKIGDVESWMGLLAKHEPGDEVKVGVLREGQEITLTVKLQGR